MGVLSCAGVNQQHQRKIILGLRGEKALDIIQCVVTSKFQLGDVMIHLFDELAIKRPSILVNE